MHLNLHQLELFYYAARYGGLTQATARMPYGLDPSTLSRQLCELERQTGLTLYMRRVFELTPAGENLYAFIKPLFEDLPGLIQDWRKGLPESVRLGASPVVLREYLPPILTALQKKFPGLKLACDEASQPQIELYLKEKSIDLAIMILEGTLPSGYESEPIARLPLVLLVPEKSKVRSATELWRREAIAETLVALPPENPVTQYF